MSSVKPFFMAVVTRRATIARAASIFLAAIFSLASFAQTPPDFNHNSTGFPLQGVHLRLQCVACHGPGLPTRGLPKDCNNCHVQGARAATFEPPNHIPNPPTQSCLDCHNQTTFASAVMKHTTDMTGQCARCHNSVQATGKPITHIPTTASCDSCHTTGQWNPPKMVVHDASTVGRCSTCHNGTIASGKPPTHIPTNAQCDTCHTSTVTWLNAQFLHDSSVIGRCSACHNNQIAIGRSAGHIPVNTQCDTCHTSYVSFFIVTMNHTGLNGQCSNCHNGAFLSQNAQTKPPTHIVTNAQCDLCHKSTTTWATAANPHLAAPPFTPTTGCITCHNNVSAIGKPTNHIPVGNNCETCHLNNGYTAFKPALMDHTGTAGQCLVCHTGAYVAMNAQTKPTIHIPTARSCDACHYGGFAQFYPGIMDHSVGTAGQCSTCHNGTYLSENAQMKPTTHVATSAQCDACHNSTITWATAVYSHTDPTVIYFGNCSFCHKPGGPGLSKPTNHIPTNFQCDTCHSNFIVFKPASMNHTGTTGLCSNCHNGSYTFALADAQGTTHIPETRQCDTCHTSTVLWTLMTFVHPANAPGNCSNCHGGQYLTENAQAKPVTHIVTIAQCDSCHTNAVTSLSWATSAAPDHTTFIANCRNCHVPGASPGPQGLTQPATHIPVGVVQCDQCHSKYPSLFKPATMNHTAAGLTLVCATCHNGAYASINALPQGPTHVPTGAACDLCHSNTAYISWTNRVMSHAAGAIGSTACATCHSGGYLTENAQAKGANHIPIGAATCDKCHPAPASGNTPDFTTVTMDHTQVYPANACATCHGGAYLSENAQTKPATGHVATALACNSSGCHSGYTSWATAMYAHNQAGDQTSCGLTCHNIGQLGLPKPTTHVPTTITPCGVCHTTWPPVPGGFSLRPFMTHTGAMAGTCSTCHNATYAFTNANPQGTTHIPTTAQCDGCHTAPGGAWTSRVMNHTLVAATTCSTCHGGAYISENAQTKGLTHIPVSVECNVCHTSTTDWTSRTMNHTAVVATPCSTCHSGGYVSENAQTKGAPHIPVTVECSNCHTSTTVWTTGSMNHAVVTATACVQCHNGTYVSQTFGSLGGAQWLMTVSNHIPLTSASLAPLATVCSSCHTSTTSWLTVTKATMRHNGMMGGGVGGFCTQCHLSSPAYLGVTRTINALHNGGNAATPGKNDCSASSCHGPLGHQGSFTGMVN